MRQILPSISPFSVSNILTTDKIDLAHLLDRPVGLTVEAVDQEIDFAHLLKAPELVRADRLRAIHDQQQAAQPAAAHRWQRQYSYESARATKVSNILTGQGSYQ